jgi:hypothetical protein
MSTVTMQSARGHAALREATPVTNPIVSFLHAVSAAFKPAPRRPLTRFEEAERVRRLAASVADTDPGFAADLYAAAARHDGYDD